MSFNPSPTRLIPKTVIRIAIPGIAQSHQAVRRNSLPEPIMNPQLMTFGSPRPRNASADSIRIAVAVISEAVTSIGERTFGRISRKIMEK